MPRKVQTTVHSLAPRPWSQSSCFTPFTLTLPHHDSPCRTHPRLAVRVYRRIALDWVNRPEVRAALHAEPVSKIGEWQPCSDVLYYRLDTAYLVPVHEQLIMEGR